MDFYIGAIEPEKLTGEKYWMRFLTTLLMPIIGIIIIIVSHVVTMVVTPYAAYNKYGGLLAIIPMILVTYFNMVAQPLMAFIYICFGACGTRNNSNQCPYDTGTCQFTRNMKFKLNTNLNILLTHRVLCSYFLHWVFTRKSYTIPRLVALNMFPDYNFQKF